MKSNSFVCTTAIVQIVHFISWILLILWCWWRKFVNWHLIERLQHRQQFKHTTPDIMYEFRPFQLQLCDYKSYSKTKYRGRGKNFIPKPRSGHRIAANEMDLFSFGGKRFDSVQFSFNENFLFLLEFEFIIVDQIYCTDSK